MNGPAKPMHTPEPAGSRGEDSPEQLWLELERMLHRLRRAIVVREAAWQQAAANARRRREQG